MPEKNFSEKFLTGWSRKLEIMLLILDGEYWVESLASKLPISRNSIYCLLRRYRRQGLIKVLWRESENGSMRLEITKTGKKWLSYRVSEEVSLRRKHKIDTSDISHWIKLVGLSGCE